MEITKELKEKILNANSEEEVKAILGDEATPEEAAFIWEKLQAKKAEGELEAVDDDELEAVSGGDREAVDGHEIGCSTWFWYKNDNEVKVKICPNGSKEKGWYHDWDISYPNDWYTRYECKKCGEVHVIY